MPKSKHLSNAMKCVYHNLNAEFETAMLPPSDKKVAPNKQKSFCGIRFQTWYFQKLSGIAQLAMKSSLTNPNTRIENGKLVKEGTSALAF